MSLYKWALTVKEGLALINSLIEGTKYKKAVSDFQERFCGKTMKKDTEKGKVGKKYWISFMKQQRKVVRTKRGEKYAGNRTNWSTYTNFEDMYDACYL